MLAYLKIAALLIGSLGAGIGVGIGVDSIPDKDAIKIEKLVKEHKDKWVVVSSLDVSPQDSASKKSNLESSKELFSKLKELKFQYVGFISDKKGETICKNMGYNIKDSNWFSSLGWKSYKLGSEKKFQNWRCIYKE